MACGLGDTKSDAFLMPSHCLIQFWPRGPLGFRRVKRIEDIVAKNGVSMSPELPPAGPGEGAHALFKKKTLSTLETLLKYQLAL